MKRIYSLILFTTISLFFIGCVSMFGDKIGENCYVYRNDTTKTITMECYHLSSDEVPVLDSSYIIKPGEEKTECFEGYSIERGGFPFGWYDGQIYETAYIIVSNGEREVTLKYKTGGSPFYVGYYEFKSSKEKGGYALYTITDAIFDEKPGLPL